MARLEIREALAALIEATEAERRGYAPRLMPSAPDPFRAAMWAELGAVIESLRDAATRYTDAGYCAAMAEEEAREMRFAATYRPSLAGGAS